MVKPKAATVPIIASEYDCRYLNAAQLATDGGPVAFFADWLDHEARSKHWRAKEARRRQGDPFRQS